MSSVENSRAEVAWWLYVERNTRGETQKEMALESGIDQTLLSRWKLAKNPPSPEKVIAFARGVNRSPVEALIAAGYLTAQESSIAVEVVRPASDLDDTELLAEIRRRLEDRHANR